MPGVIGSQRKFHSRPPIQLHARNICTSSFFLTISVQLIYHSYSLRSLLINVTSLIKCTTYPFGDLYVRSGFE